MVGLHVLVNVSSLALPPSLSKCVRACVCKTIRPSIREKRTSDPCKTIRPTIRGNRSLRVRSRTHVRRGLHATARARPRHGATPATPSDRPAQKTDHPRKRRGAANLRVLSTTPLVAGAAVVVVDPGVARGQRQRRLVGLVHTRRRSKHSRLRRNPDVRLHHALPTWRRLA